MIGFHHGEGARALLWLLQLLQNMVAQRLIIQNLPPKIEGESPHFAACFAPMRPVPIIFGTPGDEFDDMITGGEFVGHIAQKIADGDTG